MPAAFNVTQRNSTRTDSNPPVPGSLKRCLPKLLQALLICFLVSTVSVAQTESKPTKAPSDAQKAFEQMKSLAGSWHGTIMNISIDVTIRVASSGTAILHEANTDGDGPPKHEITMFYLDGDRLLATHY